MCMIMYNYKIIQNISIYPLDSTWVCLKKGILQFKADLNGKTLGQLHIYIYTYHSCSMTKKNM